MVSQTDWAGAERVKYAKVWSLPRYREISPGAKIAPAAIESLGMSAGDSIWDFGCGEGHAMRAFYDHGMRTFGCDIVDVIHPDYQRQEIYREFHCCPLWELPMSAGDASWGFSSDVLEHLPTELVAESLRRMAEHVLHGMFLQIAHFPDHGRSWHGDLDGLELHLTVQPVEWWSGVLRETLPDWDVILESAGNGAAPRSIWHLYRRD